MSRRDLPTTVGVLLGYVIVVLLVAIVIVALWRLLVWLYAGA